MNTLQQHLGQSRVVPVIVVNRANDILPLGELLMEHGLPLAEVTFRTPCAAQAIRLLRQAQPEMLVGAGTLHTAEHIAQAIDAGAMFGVSAGINANTVQYSQQHNFPLIPGVNNPMAIELAIELGIDFLKFFPAEASGGTKMLKALLGPYQHLSIMPTGGISLQNIQDYLAIPQVVACGGSWMVEPGLVETRQWETLASRIKETVQQLQR